jgi:hypothetical protein
VTFDPHREILEFWRAVARFSFKDGTYVIGGPAHSNSIDDARQLLCILWPATQLARYRLDDPELTGDEVLEPLKSIGDSRTVPQRLIRALAAYMLRYRNADGFPTFENGEDATVGHDCVESFAASVQLCLATLGFVRVFRPSIVEPGMLAEADQLKRLADIRLSTAMVGLLRSFAVTAFDDDSAEGHALYQLIAQQHRQPEAVLAEYRLGIAEVRARVLNDIVVGSVLPGGADRMTYVSCGWAWGVIRGAPAIETSVGGIRQAEGIAAPQPDPYLTWVASEAVRELLSTRTRLLDLLGDEQSRLALALQLRFELSRSYWSHLATFGAHRWPLEQLPWPVDNADYTSVVVAGLVLHNVAATRGNTDLAYALLFRVLGRLATRHAIVRPPRADDSPPAVLSDDHRFRLSFADPDRVGWHPAPDLSAQLFAVLLDAAAMTDSEQLRREFIDLAELVWDHLPAGMPTANWRNAHRLISGLVNATDLMNGGAGRFRPALSFVHQLLADAATTFESLPDNVTAATRDDIAARLQRAELMVDQHPARAAALLYRVLEELDELL